MENNKTYLWRIIRPIIILAICGLLSIQSSFAQDSLVKMEEGPKKHKICISQGSDFALVAYGGHFKTLLIGNNLKGGNLDFAINYNYRTKSGVELLSNVVYVYDRDFYTYYDYFLDEYGPTEIRINAHLIRYEFGIKYFSKASKYNLYTRVSASISFSLYRRNNIYSPGFDHYEEYRGLQYSHVNFIMGKGIEVPTYKNQYFMVEMGLDLPLPLNNHSNLVYSLDIYFKVGYGFTF